MFFGNRMAVGLIFIGLSLVLVSQLQAGVRYRGSVVNWGTDWQPPRAEARLNLENDLSPILHSRLQGVCYDLLEKDDKPSYLYWGLGFRRGNLMLEPTIGWSFMDKEIVGAFRLYPKWKTWFGYSNCEYQFKTKSFYYLAQLGKKFSPFFEMGTEIEGWGDINDNLQSTGFGLNFAFNLHAVGRLKAQKSKLRVEVAIQYRELGNQWKPQAVVRLIFTPKMEEHTPSHRRD